MLSSIKQRLDREDEGFTLIELMVVVLIIAILLAIAIPTFLSARDSANARASQSNLRNALTAEQTYYTNNQAFNSTATTMQTIENSLTWATTDATTRNANQIDAAVGTNAVTNDSIELMAYGKDNKCYTIYQVNEATSSVPAGTYFIIKAPVSSACVFPTAPSAAATNGSAATNYGSGANTTWYTSW